MLRRAAGSLVVSVLFVFASGQLLLQPATAASFELRVNVGAGSAVDSSGRTWAADRHHAGGGGIQWATGVAINGTFDDEIFQTNRWGMDGYNLPLPRKGTYSVRLLFAETVFSQAGRRVFDVTAEGRLVADDLDVYAKVGSAAAYVHAFSVSTADRTLNLRFPTVVESPMISGIEVTSGMTAGTTTTTVAPTTSTTAPPATTTTTAPAATTTTTRPASTSTTAPAATTTTTKPARPTTTAPARTTTTTRKPARSTTTAPAPTTTTTTKPARPTTTAPAPTTTTTAPPANAGGYPGPSNTGVPSGTALRSSGSITTTAEGQVIDALDVSGSIRVEHNNVTIKRVRIRNSYGQAITMNPGKTNLVVEDCEIDGTGNTNGASAIGDSNFTMRRCNVHHFGEGPRINGNNVIEHNWFHDFTSFVAQGAHQDVVQSTGGSHIVIRHNSMDMNVDGANAAIMLGTYQGNDVLIENNWLAGGGYTVYGGGSNGYTNVRILNNRFSTKWFPRSGYHGPLVYAANATVSGNVWAETGLPL